MKRLLAFDMDGTLINSLGITIEVLARTVQSFTNIMPTRDEIVSHFGVSEEKIFANVFGVEQGPAMNLRYNEFFKEDVHKTEVFSGITNMLKELSNMEDVSLALYTARGRGTTDILLEHHRLLDFFDYVITGSEVSLGKPHPEGLQKIKAALGFSNEPMYYVGDSHKDIEMAKAIGATPVGVQWCPLVDKETLSASQPHKLFSEPSQLHQYLLIP